MNWLLLRGLVREKRHWEGFDRRLADAFPDDKVLVFDLPGNGAFYREPSPVSVARMVEHLRSQLQASGTEPPFAVVALSLGGMVGVDWLSRYPRELAGLVLINSSSGRFSPFWKRLRPSIYSRLFGSVILTGNKLKREQTILQVTSNMRSGMEINRIAARWAELAAQKPVSVANGLRQLLAAARFRAPASLPPGVPVTVLCGAGDRLVHPDCSAHIAQAWSLPIETHKEAGHDLPLDDPEWLIAQLALWKQQNSG